MEFRRNNDVDGNGMADVSQPQENNRFDLAESDEVAEMLERKGLISESEEKKAKDQMETDATAYEVPFDPETINLVSREDLPEKDSLSLNPPEKSDDPENYYPDGAHPGDVGDLHHEDGFDIENIEPKGTRETEAPEARIPQETAFDPESIAPPEERPSQEAVHKEDASFDPETVKLQGSTGTEDTVTKSVDTSECNDGSLERKENLPAEELMSVEGPHAVNSEKLSNLAEKDLREQVEESAQNEGTDYNQGPQSENKIGKYVTENNTAGASETKQEIHQSRFSTENFQHEDSFDAYAKENFSALNELKSKCVYDVQPMGTPDEMIDRTNKNIYTNEERQYIKDIRDSIDAPDENTIMQKVIAVDTGDIEKDLDTYLNPRDFNGQECEAHVTGCVAKAEDAAPFTKTPQECFDNLRLDYPGTAYQDPNQSVYVVRFTNGTNYDIPYSAETDSGKIDPAPMTGTGFTGSKEHIIPENTVRPEGNKGAIVTDGEIYRINPDATEEKVAYYNENLNKFCLYDEVNNK